MSLGCPVRSVEHEFTEIYSAETVKAEGKGYDMQNDLNDYVYVHLLNARSLSLFSALMRNDSTAF